MFSMVWSFLNLFSFEVHYKSYDNRDITAEYMPALVPSSGVLPLKNGDFLETDLSFSIFFSFLFFSVFFVLSLCSKKIIRFLLFLIIITEFFVGRFIVSYFKYEYVQLLVLRVMRMSALLISLFLLLLSCFCCQCVFPELLKPNERNKPQSKSK